jgi:hypothetical protein
MPLSGVNSRLLGARPSFRAASCTAAMISSLVLLLPVGLGTFMASTSQKAHFSSVSNRFGFQRLQNADSNAA